MKRKSSVCIGFVLACASALLSHGQEKPAKTSSAVHVVGIYNAANSNSFRLVQPWLRDTNCERLGQAIVEQARQVGPNPGKRIWQFFPEDAKNVAMDIEALRRMDKQTIALKDGGPLDNKTLRGRQAFERGLREALRRADFYDEKSFAGITLDEETARLLKRHKDLLLLETWVLNRRLFEAAFSNSVSKSKYSLQSATVPVRVGRTDEPVILVLCSYESVLWDVQLDKGAKIERVIVGGNHLSSLRGTEAPIDYHISETPNKEHTFFFAYQKDAEYGKMEQAMRKLTGREISSFQGRYKYADGPPFVIGKVE